MAWAVEVHIHRRTILEGCNWSSVQTLNVVPVLDHCFFEDFTAGERGGKVHVSETR